MGRQFGSRFHGCPWKPRLYRIDLPDLAGGAQVDNCTVNLYESVLPKLPDRPLYLQRVSRDKNVLAELMFK